MLVAKQKMRSEASRQNRLTQKNRVKRFWIIDAKLRFAIFASQDLLVELLNVSKALESSEKQKQKMAIAAAAGWNRPVGL